MAKLLVKVYTGENGRSPQTFRKWVVDDENLQDVQAEIAEFVADDLYRRNVHEDIQNGAVRNV